MSRRSKFLRGFRRTGWLSKSADNAGATWRDVNTWYRDDPAFRGRYDAIDLYRRKTR